MNTESPEESERIAEAIRFLHEQQMAQPRLEDLARHLQVSPFHLQRTFQRWAGISPKRFLQVLTVSHAKQLFAAGHPVLETALATGLSGPGRLHDLFVTLEAVTPGEYRRRGAGVQIAYGFHPSPFGTALVAVTARGLCGLAFCDDSGREETLTDLRRHWPEAAWVPDQSASGVAARRVFEPLDPDAGKPLAVLVRGTNFQVRVWEALLQIPPGRVTTYTNVAAAAGRPRAIRAAASAVGDNPVSWLIPCHRVIRTTGELGGYRWGLHRKCVMLAQERWTSAATTATNL